MSIFSSHMLKICRIVRAICRGVAIKVPDADVMNKVSVGIHALSQMPEPSSITRITTDDAVFDNRIEYLLAEAIERYGHEIDAVRYWAMLRNERAFFPETGMYDWLEAQVLYLLIRCVKPDVVVEISPNYGYSTGFILMAMNKNNLGQLYSFDLEGKFYRHALRNFERVGVNASRQHFFAGEICEVYNRVLPKRIDILFMDSDHSYAFAQWYMANLYPRLVEGCLIHVHDILRYGVKPHLGDQGEGRTIWEFIKENQIPETDYLYIGDLMRSQPTKPAVIQRLERYPFGDTLIGSNNVEQNASFWMMKRS